MFRYLSLYVWLYQTDIVGPVLYACCFWFYRYLNQKVPLFICLDTICSRSISKGWQRKRGIQERNSKGNSLWIGRQNWEKRTISHSNKFGMYFGHTMHVILNVQNLNHSSFMVMFYRHNNSTHLFSVICSKLLVIEWSPLRLYMTDQIEISLGFLKKRSLYIGCT